MAAAVASGETLVLPGQVIGDTERFAAGPGTYEIQGRVVAAVMGVRRELERGSGGTGDKPALSVVHHRPPPSLRIKDVVIGRVIKISVRQASVQIICVGSALLKEPLQGAIRARDVRAFEIDSVVMHKSFRPGDVVRAEVLSMGDSRSILLSTAKNELGVVLARSAAGHVMIPQSWQHMECPVTKMKEFRKVAKVQLA
jgi:exosome complex component CSL4